MTDKLPVRQVMVPLRTSSSILDNLETQEIAPTNLPINTARQKNYKGLIDRWTRCHGDRFVVDSSSRIHLCASAQPSL